MGKRFIIRNGAREYDSRSCAIGGGKAMIEQDGRGIPIMHRRPLPFPLPAGGQELGIAGILKVWRRDMYENGGVQTSPDP